MTPRNRWLLAGAFVLGAVAIATWGPGAGLVGGEAPEAIDRPALPAAAADDGAARFEAGRTDAYAVTWTTRATKPLPVGEEALTVASHLEGTLHLTTWSVGETVVQAAQLAEVEALRVIAGGERLPLAPGDVAGVAARVERDARGGLTDISFAPEVSRPARNTLTGLLRAALVEHPGDGVRWATWGEAEDRWSDERRTTTGYASVDGVPADAAVQARGTATVDWGEGGRLLALSAADEVTAEGERPLLDATDTVALAWEGEVARPVAPPGTSAAISALQHTPDPDGSLEARARGLSATEVLRGIEGFTGDGEVAEDLMWRGTARIALEPGLAERVAEQVTLPGTARPARELGLDLLAHASSAEAEAALREVLSSETVVGDPAYPAYLSRLSFVEDPQPATVAWLHERLDAPDPAVRRSAMATAGAVGGRIARAGGDPAEALDPLRGMGNAAPEDQAAALMGLGNAAQPDDLGTLLAATGHQEPTVRAAAVHALRHYGDEAAASALRGAVADDAAVVQRAALSRLAERGLGAADRRAVRDVVKAGELHASNLQVTLSALAEDRADPVARETLAELVDHPRGDPATRARIRALLEPR